MRATTTMWLTTTVATRVFALAVFLLGVGGDALVGMAQPILPPGAEQPPAANKAVLWGALAFTADGSWSTAWRMPSKAEAEAKVAVDCAKFGRGQCKVLSFTGELCAALATYIGARYKTSYSGGGLTIPEAQKSAMGRCNADARTRGRCQLRTVVCGDGR